MLRSISIRPLALAGLASVLLGTCAVPALAADLAGASPKVVLISLDGAKPDVIQEFVQSGVLKRNGGLARLSRQGVVARRNITATPSLTAVSHIAIATGSTAANNDIPANSFHPVAGTIATGISGFGAPIGGYEIQPLGPESKLTAVPLWVRLRAQGKAVVAATWPGADGADIRINNTLVQPASPTRITDYAVPFGAFGGLGANGYALDSADFAEDAEVAAELKAAGKKSFSPILVTTAPFETVSCASTTSATCAANTSLDLVFAMNAAALDSTNDGKVNYDTLVFFDAAHGIQPGPFALPSTGPAYVKASGTSGKFFFEGSGNKVGAAYYVSYMAPDLSTVRFARYGSNYIPRNAAALGFVDDINNNVGFWAPQSDFRIPERLSPGFDGFPDIELEAMYEDQVETFVEYQTSVALRSMSQSADSDLVMVYIEEPDGSGHQFTLTDPRQATDFRDSSTIGSNQDALKVARYAEYVEFAYQQADRAVSRIMEAAGPDANVFVVSDHGMAPFHTAVNVTNVLRNAGVDTAGLGIRTSGAAVNVYVNLAGRESGGTVDAATYVTKVRQIARALSNAQDPNGLFSYSLTNKRIFGLVAQRPTECDAGPGFCKSQLIGQDSGDVFAMLAEGYNFDGIQNPVVVRQGDPAFNADTTMFSTPNFYGAHGYDPRLPAMSATFIAAGPNIREGRSVPRVNNIDVAPTIMHLLGVRPGKQVNGEILTKILK
jgi:predicted AlkP superfamily pyrophosphatase or phosphodiesterase